MGLRGSEVGWCSQAARRDGGRGERCWVGARHAVCVHGGRSWERLLRSCGVSPRSPARRLFAKTGHGEQSEGRPHTSAGSTGAVSSLSSIVRFYYARAVRAWRTVGGTYRDASSPETLTTLATRTCVSASSDSPVRTDQLRVF